MLRRGQELACQAPGTQLICVADNAAKITRQGEDVTLVASARKTGGVVTVENQSILGGLGGAVCEILSEEYPVRVKRLGIPNRFGEVATEDYLFEKHGFGVPHIVAAAK